MTLDTWIVYLIAVLVLTASPGPSALLCMTKGVTHGTKTGLYTALGSLTAITSILTLSFVGLGVIISSSEWLFNIIKWIGAAYLVYLGIQSFRSQQQDYQAADNKPSEEANIREHFLSGFIVGASNPKAILFFSALFPQFIDASSNMLVQYIIFCLTFVVLEFSWLMLYVRLGNRSSSWLFAKGRAKLFNRLTGGVFIGAGTLLSFSSRN
ncbi:LysE family translocator [Vibrio genomosp. F10]|uniref:Flagellar biosynthesis protein FlgM n=1 Tax=Vibrio genomosp. F10 str. ZF-129 TaxID=1187848 RepID=A0A1E5BD02_9VIBR|nr:LysE family translocator [Vibrio genomosp. F10]OEE32628.1 flagellar biosynthesis protein FlgM [Vibrio genomosp. F10 str. ZF-129]OEE91150.1 flagellar biosynthesis protein FlgM [Vibrio genomosp. F10 str. 9ZD137]OEE98406.1 flagellar biosynthesis protein FlgM [Vibrio genomosp. F10 str. 9ZC157]OEF07648.1 flagellar biosynthesis protein FlgM [Vibrio genomosp. F10 str. 9ZB36]